MEFTICGKPAKWSNASLYKFGRILELVAVSDIQNRIKDLGAVLDGNPEAELTLDHIDTIAAIIAAACSVEIDEAREMALSGGMAEALAGVIQNSPLPRETKIDAPEERKAGE